MKILHTSDWHLGQEFYSYDRTEEHLSFLAQLKTIVRDEKPDVMVVSGDIYHNATPSNTVMRMFTDNLEQICGECPSMQVVVTAGNHDSSSRLEVTRNLWSHLNVHIIGRIEKKDDCVDFDRHIIRIKDKDGRPCGYVVAMPHVFPLSFPIIKDEAPREERQSVFFQALGDRVKEVNTEGLPVVMMVHMAITGSDITGHDNICGGMEFTDISTLKVDYDYLALGHIHCPQTFADDHARYCGSPIPVSFDERYQHSVTVVEIKNKGDIPLLRVIPVRNPIPLKTIPSEAVPFDEALKELEKFPDDERAYIRLHVKVTDVVPHNAMERAEMAVKEKQCRFCCFKWEQSEKDKDVQTSTFKDVEQMKEKSPVDIAEIYYENKFGNKMDDDLRGMLRDVVSQIESAEM